MREILRTNGIDAGNYSSRFLDTRIVRPAGKDYAHVINHINPSAEELFVITNTLKVVATLSGWELVTLKTGSIVYQRSQVHFAPTHALEISIFDPASGQDKLIYPPVPAQAVRQAFIRRVADVYQQRGEAWFREHNHHMNSELFDSRLVSEVTVDASHQSLSFAVQFGDPENANDPLPFSEQVAVTCAPLNDIDRLSCAERLR